MLEFFVVFLFALYMPTSNNPNVLLTYIGIYHEFELNRIERAASALMKDVASLLVFQDIFRSPQAQAFLKVLLALRRGDDALKLLDSYGEFFRLMAVGGYSSWEDYILDGILIGEANPFAEAAASLGYPLNPWFGQIPPSLEAAAAADLEALQRLSITESTLSGWVLELADAKPEWRSAVTSSLSCHNGHKHLDDDEAHIGLSGLNEDNKRHSDKEDLLETSKVIDNLVINREMWRKRIGGLWKWSEAMPLLKEYYPKHGVGRVATSQVLLLKGGKLVSDLKFFYRGKNHCELTVHRSQRQDIIGFLREHSLKYSPNHLLLCGPTGSGKSSLLHAISQKLVREGDLRVVTMPDTELKNLGFVLEELGKFCNVRFALFIDDPFARAGEENLRMIKSSLDENLQEWPENVFLIVTSNKPELYDGISSVTEGSSKWVELKHIFGRIIFLEKLNFDQFLQSVQEMLDHRKQRGFPISVTTSLEINDATIRWTQQRGVLNLRSAAQLAKSLW
ncbi:hypothetical protein O6H91_03G031100 [Diphasiastrum complanatum]|uniref:Uncharacterized protein n=1 Tax=Diphasiastrum complanatum TaxID=34168 RepID=A0ACC2E4Q4_DIPCM|nr:hypothetical protein O6H91_03G031100 [Diphasiastrum complanatum]